MKSAKDVMLAWNPGTAEVALIRWPATRGEDRKYEMTALACNSDVQEATFEQRKTIVFIEAMHLIIADECDPFAVHSALLGLEEYVDGCAEAMPGVGG
jgi:hypothetical protein